MTKPFLYMDFIMSVINKNISNKDNLLAFGENIDTGSKISGLARGLEVNNSSKILNVGNCELTHCGVGFGMMMDGGSSVLFSKQLDFMLLGLDQICNTYNSIRAFESKKDIGSFTIFVIVCDQGLQGPQSSFNGPSDFFSMANIPVYCLNESSDIEKVIKNNFVNKGFRIICLSQKEFKNKLNAPAAIYSSKDQGIFQYEKGSDVTFLNFNFGLKYFLQLSKELNKNNISSDVFHINFLNGMNLKPLIDSIKKTKKIVLLDDSKSVLKYGDYLLNEFIKLELDFKIHTVYRRGTSDLNYGVNEDILSVSTNDVIKFIKKK